MNGAYGEMIACTNGTFPEMSDLLGDRQVY